MKKTAKAKIQWILPEDGGRKKTPSGPQYSTVVRFEGDTSDWLGSAWSLVLEFNEPPNISQDTIATIWFLAYDKPDAPNHLLEIGNHFELFEGEKLVATGKIFARA